MRTCRVSLREDKSKALNPSVRVAERRQGRATSSRNRKKRAANVRSIRPPGATHKTMLVRVQRPCFGEASSWPEENKQKYLKNERDLHYVDRSAWNLLCVQP